MWHNRRKINIPCRSKCTRRFTNILFKRQKREQSLNLINAPSIGASTLAIRPILYSDSHVFINQLRPRFPDRQILTVILWTPLLKLLPTIWSKHLKTTNRLNDVALSTSDSSFKTTHCFFLSFLFFFPWRNFSEK